MAIAKTVFDVVKDSIKPYIDLNAGNIAAVEKTSTAAAAHLAGTQIVFKGKLYDVIQDIAQNGTIIVGTNIVAADSLSSDIATLSNLRAELGAHNLIDINAYLTLSNTSIANNGIVSTATDSRNASIYFRCFKGSTAVGNALINQDISTGQFSKEITIPSNYDFDSISIGHNGASKDLKVSLPFSRTGAFIFSCNVTGANTSVSGGYALEDIMLRLADDISTVYGEFSKPNTELTKDDSGLTANAFANGAVNLVETQTINTVRNGITIITNADKSITLNGTSTASTIIELQKGGDSVRLFRDGKLQTGKRYKVSGCPKNSFNGNVKLILNYSFNGSFGECNDFGDGTIADIPYGASGGNFIIVVENNVTVTNLTFKPMITVADMPNSDYAHYVPYAKSNKELTRLIKKKTATVTTSGSGNASIATDLVPYSAQILAINVTSGAANGAIAVAYKNLGASVNGLHVVAPDGTSLASTQIGIEVIYIDGADVT